MISLYIRIYFMYPHLQLVYSLGINRLCSATFEQLSLTFCSASNLEQLLLSLATFEQQIGIKLIQTIKKVFIQKVFLLKVIKTKDV